MINIAIGMEFDQVMIPCKFSLYTYRGYPAERALSAMRKHDG